MHWSEVPLTDWMPGLLLPVRPGVYQRSRELPDGKRTQPMYASYRGGVWHQSSSTPDEAERMAFYHERSMWQRDMEWRGLSEDPDK